MSHQFDRGWIGRLLEGSYTPTEQTRFRSSIGANMRGHIFGLRTQINATDTANDIDIFGGECASDSNPPMMMFLNSTLTKRVDALWAAGSGNGGLDTGSAALSTWYHLFIIGNPTTGVVDALFSTSATAPVMPSGYTHKRRIASMFRSNPAAWLGYLQDGDYFIWQTNSLLAYSSTAARAYAALGISTPPGVVTYPVMHLSGHENANSSVQVAIDTLGVTAAHRAAWFYDGTQDGTYDARIFGPNLRTNGSSQIGFSVTISAGSLVRMELFTHGWMDPRGRW